MRVLVTGAGGQVGRAVARRARGVEIVGLDRAALDVTDAAAVRAALREHAPDAVIHAAAFTAVDRAEAEREAAVAVNRDGTAHVADACREVGARLVALSTDYVFDGTASPYAPDAPTRPLNVYGASKAAGERAALAAGGTVLRTAWVVSEGPEGFVAAILRAAASGRALRVVDDQWGHPTPAAFVADAALAAVQTADLPPILHAAGSPLATWHALAVAAVDAAESLPAASVEAVSTEAYGSAAPRPRQVELHMGPSLAALGLEPCDWRAWLPGVVRAWERRRQTGTL